MNLENLKENLDPSHHPLYQHLTSIENVRTFMKYHVFAVWDFMSLLKSLQREITCVELPWVESKYDPETVRLVNEIVLCEESDIDENGRATSHFNLYLMAMKELGADTELILSFLQDRDLDRLPKELKEIIGFHLDIAMNKEVHEVASSFFYGREKLIPEMFESIVKTLENASLNCPTLKYYLKRHIEIDGENHGPMAKQCLDHLTDTLEKKKNAMKIARDSLAMRNRLWSFILSEIQA